MAELTKETAIGLDWTEVTATLGMVDGETYVVEVDGPDGGLVRAVDTDSADAPAAASRGHAWRPTNAAGTADVREFEKKAGHFWYLRASLDGMRVIATEV